MTPADEGAAVERLTKLLAPVTDPKDLEWQVLCCRAADVHAVLAALKKVAESAIASPAGERWFSGTIGEHQGHGVWVPPGLDAASILRAAQVLEEQFGVEPFLSRHQARAVLQACLPPKEVLS